MAFRRQAEISSTSCSVQDWISENSIRFGIIFPSIHFIKTRLIQELRTGTVNVWEVPGYRTEMSPFGGIKDSGLGYKEGVVEAMKSFTNVKTFSLPWG
ncbi:MAG TPA: aldehyde dehydrogenase family protein, partial [Rhodospirillales bacterium]|nr:aldehyde dehydrogenase family protein [Rhodospirillales bacterium]